MGATGRKRSRDFPQGAGSCKARARRPGGHGPRYNEPVSRVPRTALLWLVGALLTAGAVLAIAGDDDGGNAPRTRVEGIPSTTRAPPGRTTHDRTNPHREARHPESTHAAVREAVAESKSPRLDPAQRDVTAVVRNFVAALNAKDGERACALFASGALAGFDFPRERGDCATSLSASVGYRSPRGTPVYGRSRVPRIPSVTIDGSQARVTATVVTRFADDREPSVEDDVIYLVNTDGSWLIAKPSATLYRAVGAGNIPPQVLAPP